MKFINISTFVLFGLLLAGTDGYGQDRYNQNYHIWGDPTKSNNTNQSERGLSPFDAEYYDINNGNNFRDGLALIRENDKYGFVDKSGNKVVSCIYTNAECFLDGFARVKRDGKCGYVDKTGKEIVPCEYEEIEWFLNDLALVKKTDRRDKKRCGFVDRTGKEVIPCVYNKVIAFSPGYVVLANDEGVGCLDKDGKEIIPFIYDEMTNFVNDVAIVGKYNKDERKIHYGLIHKSGRILRPCKHEKYYMNTLRESMNSDDLVIIKENDKYGFIDKLGNTVVPCIYDQVDVFSDGLAPVKKGDKWGFIDVTGKETIPCIYQGQHGFKNGQAPVLKKGKWGYIDKSGNEILPCKLKYHLAFAFSNGLAPVKKDDKWGFINQSGELVIPCIYDFIKEVSEDHYRVGIRVDNRHPNFRKQRSENGVYGLVDKKSGKEVLPCIYWGIGNFSEGFAVVEDQKGFGYINSNGEISIPCKLGAAENFKDGLAKVYMHGKWGFIDTTGYDVVPCKYTHVKDFHDGVAVVEKNINILCVDHRGNEIPLQRKYEKINDFKDGFAKVYTGSRWGIINTEGREIVPCRFDDEKDLEVNKYGLLKFTGSKGAGYINKSGKEIIPCVFSFVRPFQYGYAICALRANYKDNRYVADKNGVINANYKQKTYLADHNGVISEVSWEY